MSYDLHEVQMSYNLHEVPARDGSRSRFALTSSPTGVSLTPGKAVTVAYLNLVDERRKQAEPIGELSKEIPLRKIGRLADGSGYAVVDSGSVVAVPDAKPAKTGKHHKSNLAGGSLLDDAFLGGPSFREAHDRDLYEAARVVAEEEQMRATDLLDLNRAVQLLVLARAGVTALRPADLPLLRG
jgi:hypothetical protein